MTGGGVPSSKRDPIETLAARIAGLDVMIWRVGMGANTWARLVAGHPQGGAFDSRAMSDAVRGAVESWAGGSATFEPGFAVSVLGSDDAHGVMTVAMTLDRSFDASEYSRRFRGKGGPAIETMAGVDSMRRFEGADREQVVQIAKWMHEDLANLDENRDVILRFSRELMESYEQIGLLYRLGRAMGSRTQPQQFVSDLCSELEQNTRFGWVAALFDEHSERSNAVAGRFDLGGRSVDRRGCVLESLEVLEQTLDSSGAAVLHPKDDAFAATVASELAVQSLQIDGEPRGLLVAGDKSGDDPGVSSVDTQLLKAASEFMSVFLDNARMYEEQRRLFMGTLQALTASIDAKDRYTCGHSERVAILAVLLAEELDLDPDYIEDVRVAGLVHDVGKIGVPEAVLQKPGKLTAEEFGLIQQHPATGYRILQDVPQFTRVLPGVLHHHERWDGGGYPLGLSREEIPRIARLLSVADTFDAMSSTRSYREAMSRKVVLAEMSECAGSQLDPELTPIFVELDFAKYDETVRRHAAQYKLAA